MTHQSFTAKKLLLTFDSQLSHTYPFQKLFDHKLIPKKWHKLQQYFSKLTSIFPVAQPRVLNLKD